MKTLLTIISVTIVGSLLLGSPVMADTNQGKMLKRSPLETHIVDQCIYDRVEALYFCESGFQELD